MYATHKALSWECFFVLRCRMAAKRTRLDRFIAQRHSASKADARLWIAQSKIRVDGAFAVSVQQLVDEFSCIEIDGQPLQSHQPLYMMLNKPVGFLSATKDLQHPVVTDLIIHNPRENLTQNLTQNPTGLHLVGRLDLHSSGLTLLTNDGLWSQNLIAPQNKVPKVYEVVLQNPIDEKTIQGFAKGIYFAYEQSVTRPALLEKRSAYVARVTLWDGRFHQIKRMFKAFGNRVMALHRTQIGQVKLDENLLPGQWRYLTAHEVSNISTGCEPFYDNTKK